MSARLPTGLLAAGLVLIAAGPARAVYQCGPDRDDCQCGMYNPYPCCDNGGNCTWWAWEEACCNWGIGLPGWGNANQWAGNARANGNYAVLGYSVSSAVSCRASGTYGHVAWVTGSGSTITVTEQNCWGGYGHRTWNYAESWFDGGYIVRAGQTQCRPGDSQTQGCGRCGAQQRGCNGAGTWDGWGGCGGEGPCSPGQTESQGCGRCGQQTRTCGGDCQWGGWSECSGEGACAPGESATEACGRCGARARACGSDCQWPDWGGCDGEGPCAPGDSEDQPCGDCGLQSRSCNADCQWGDFDVCASIPSEGDPEPCDTGLPGICAQGARRCADGTLICEQLTPPADSETCNGLDDDCDDETDEELDCPDAGSSPAGDGGGSGNPDAALEAPPVEAVGGGCGCQAAGDGFAGLVALFAAGALGRRRRMPT